MDAPIGQIVLRRGGGRLTARRILRGVRNDVFRVHASSPAPWLIELDEAWAGGSQNGA